MPSLLYINSKPKPKKNAIRDLKDVRPDKIEEYRREKKERDKRKRIASKRNPNRVYE